MAYVYYLRVGSADCFKVGWTKNKPEERKDNVSVGSPQKLTLCREIETEHASEVEHFVHELLEMKRAENGEFFYVTAAELDDAIDQAIAFLSKASPLMEKAEAFRKTEPNHEILAPSESDRAVYNELRQSKKELFLLEQKILLLQSQLQVAIGQNLGIRGIASWKWQQTARFDLDLFKRERPDLFDKYRIVSATRFFRLERGGLTI